MVLTSAVFWHACLKTYVLKRNCLTFKYVFSPRLTYLVISTTARLSDSFEANLLD